MTIFALGKDEARPVGESPDNEPAYRLAVTAVAGPTHAVADLVEAIEATLAEWQRKARKEPAQKLPPG